MDWMYEMDEWCISYVTSQLFKAERKPSWRLTSVLEVSSKLSTGTHLIFPSQIAPTFSSHLALLKPEETMSFSKACVEGLRLTLPFTCISCVVQGCCDCKGATESRGSGRWEAWERLGSRFCWGTHSVFSSCSRRNGEQERALGWDSLYCKLELSEAVSTPQWLMAVVLTFRD